MTIEATDLFGERLEPAEAELIEVYRRLRELAGHDDLAPCVAAGVRAALAAMGIVVNDLALDFEHLLDLEV